MRLNNRRPHGGVIATTAGLLSVAVHVGVMSLRFSVNTVPTARDNSQDAPLEGVHLYRFEVASESRVPFGPAAPAAPELASEDAHGEVEAAIGEERSPTPVARLAPRLFIPGLWSDWTRVRSERLDPADERRALSWALAEARDSAEAAGRATPGATEWTVGETGDRWGLGLGRLFLGGVTIPTCGGGGLAVVDCGFGMLPNRRQEAAIELWKYREILRQATRAAADRELEERRDAIRARRDAQRRDTTSARYPRSGR